MTLLEKVIVTFPFENNNFFFRLENGPLVLSIPRLGSPNYKLVICLTNIPDSTYLRDTKILTKIKCIVLSRIFKVGASPADFHRTRGIFGPDGFCTFVIDRHALLLILMVIIIEINVLLIGAFLIENDPDTGYF